MLGLVEDGPTYWAMSWRDAPSDDAVFCPVRDNGAPLSMVMRYYEDAPTYAWVRTGVTTGPVRCLPGAFARAALTRQRAAGSSRR